MAIQFAQYGRYQNHPIGKVEQRLNGTKIENWKRVEEIGQLRLNLRKEIYPPNHSLIADAAVELACVKVRLNKDEEVNELLKCAFDILRISNGRDYAIYWNMNKEKRIAELPIFDDFNAMVFLSK